MAKIKIKKGDTVMIIAGNDKGKSGVVKSIDMKKEKLIVEGQNMVKRHTKPSAAHPDGGILEKEAPIHISNVMLMEGTTTTKVGRRVEGDKIVRYAKKSGKTLA